MVLPDSDIVSQVDQRSYAAKQPLQWDDKDGHYIIRPDDELGDTRRCAPSFVRLK